MQRLIVAAYIAGTLVVSVQRGVLAFANDYAIFRAATQNLVRGMDLYVLRPEQAQDLFKYSPTFALLFAPFAVGPAVVGLVLWNLTGALLLLASLRQLLPQREALGAQVLVFLAMLRNVQSSQSNSLIAALLILSFVAMERERWWSAAASIGVAAAIKVFPLAAAILVLPRRQRYPFAIAMVVVVAVLVALPLLVTDISTLGMQYRSWLALHAAQQADVGQSAMAVLRAAVGVAPRQWLVQVVGTGILLLPLFLGRRALSERRQLRVMLLSSVLIYAVLFNHKAEKQSYVIAIAGVAVWWASSPHKAWRLAVAALVVACTNLPSADFVPATVKAAMTPLWRGPIPCTLFWLLLQGELLHKVWRLRRGGEHTEPCELDASPPKLAAKPW